MITVMDKRFLNAYNKLVDAMNRVVDYKGATYTRMTEDDNLERIQKHIKDLKVEYKEELKKRFMHFLPQEIESRLEDGGIERTYRNAVEEVRYFLSVIEDGGSHYEGEDMSETVEQCKRILQLV